MDCVFGKKRNEVLHVIQKNLSVFKFWHLLNCKSHLYPHYVF